MRNILQAIQAYFLHRMGIPYKQIADILGGSPATHKFHAYMIRKSLPEIDEFYDKNVMSIPSSLDEQIKLAHELAEKFKISLEKEEDSTPEKPDEHTTQSSAMPTLLLEAIDRSVSTVWHTQDTSYLEEEEEKEEKKKPKRDWFNLFTTLGLFGLFGLILTMINKNKREEIPAHTGMTNAMTNKQIQRSYRLRPRHLKANSIRKLIAERRGII